MVGPVFTVCTASSISSVLGSDLLRVSSTAAGLAEGTVRFALRYRKTDYTTIQLPIKVSEAW